MIIDILKAVDGVCNSFQLSTDPLLDLFDGRKIVAKSPLQIEGEYTVDRGRVFISFTASQTLEVCCERCLQPFEFINEAEANVVYVKEREDDGDEYLYQGFTIDLTPAIRDALNSSIPSVFLCKKDCKGLCRICGGNKNIIECSCEDRQRQSTSPFAVLTKIGGNEDGTT